MDMIPPGNYRAVATPISTESGDCWAQFGETKNHNPQVVLNFEIIEGDYAGRRVAWFGYFTEKTSQRTVEALRYCGFTGDDLAAAVYMPLDQEVQIVIEHEEYNGKWSAKVAWVNRAGGGGFKLDKPMDKNGLSRFAAQMKSAVRDVAEAPGKKGERGQKPSASGSTTRSAPPPDDFDQRPTVRDEDIPF